MHVFPNLVTYIIYVYIQLEIINLERIPERLSYTIKEGGTVICIAISHTWLSDYYDVNLAM